MKSIVFYVISKPSAGCAGPYWPVYPESSDEKLFVRAEITEEWDVEQALHHAKPREGETVLNSIPLD